MTSAINNLIFGHHKQSGSKSCPWGLVLSPRAYAEYAGWQMGRPIARPENNVAVFFRRKCDAHAMADAIRARLSERRGTPVHSGVAAAQHRNYEMYS